MTTADYNELGMIVFPKIYLAILISSIIRQLHPQNLLFCVTASCLLVLDLPLQICRNSKVLCQKSLYAVMETMNLTLTLSVKSAPYQKVNLISFFVRLIIGHLQVY